MGKNDSVGVLSRSVLVGDCLQVYRDNQSMVDKYLVGINFSDDLHKEKTQIIFAYLAEHGFLNIKTSKYILDTHTTDRLYAWALRPLQGEDPIQVQAVVMTILASDNYLPKRSQVDIAVGGPIGGYLHVLKSQLSKVGKLYELLKNPLCQAIFAARLRVENAYCGDQYSPENNDPLCPAIAKDMLTIASSNDVYADKVRDFFGYWKKYRPLKAAQFNPWHDDNPLLYLDDDGEFCYFFNEDVSVNYPAVINHEVSKYELDDDGTLPKDLIEKIRYEVAANVVDKDWWSALNFDALMYNLDAELQRFQNKAHVLEHVSPPMSSQAYDVSDDSDSDVSTVCYESKEEIKNTRLADDPYTTPVKSSTGATLQDVNGYGLTLFSPIDDRHKHQLDYKSLDSNEDQGKESRYKKRKLDHAREASTADSPTLFG